MLGVQKSSPARFALLKARASVLTTVATLSTKSSSKAAASVIGFANDVAYANSPPDRLKLTPGDPATPCSASLHHSYAGSPILGAPGLVLSRQILVST